MTFFLGVLQKKVPGILRIFRDRMGQNPPEHEYDCTEMSNKMSNKMKMFSQIIIPGKHIV